MHHFCGDCGLLQDIALNYDLLIHFFSKGGSEFAKISIVATREAWKLSRLELLNAFKEYAVILVAR